MYDETEELEPTIRSNRSPGIKKSVNGVPSSNVKERLVSSAPLIKRIDPIIEVMATKKEIIVDKISTTESERSWSLDELLTKLFT